MEKKLLILSLGGLLCDRINRKDRTRNFPTHRIPDAVHGSYSVYKRPFCDDFLRFCTDRFHVAIWSTSMDHYANSVLGCMPFALRSKFLFVWNQDECKDSGFTITNSFGQTKPIFFKELQKVWDVGPHFSQSNTLLIENDPYKCLLNPANTAIFPKEYRVEDIHDMGSGPQNELRRYLEGVANSKTNVPSHVKANPFGQLAIAPGHPEWNYYSEIISAVKKI